MDINDQLAEKSKTLEHLQPLISQVVIIDGQLQQVVESFEAERINRLDQIVVRLTLHSGQRQRLHMISRVNRAQQLHCMLRETLHSTQIQFTKGQFSFLEERFDELQEVAILQEED